LRIQTKSGADVSEKLKTLVKETIDFVRSKEKLNEE